MPDDQSMTLAVGRMEGQLREIVHTVNSITLGDPAGADYLPLIINPGA